MISFVDNTLQAIGQTIGSLEPETGGALFGPENADVVSRFEFDDCAVTTRTTYTPSQKLIEAIPKIESRDGIAFKGLIHAHPPGVKRPSQPDLVAYQNTLRVNPQIGWLITPIVTIDGDAQSDNTFKLTDNACMHVFKAFRGRKDLAEIEVSVPRSIPVEEVMQCVSDAVRPFVTEIASVTSGHCRFNGNCFVERTIALRAEDRFWHLTIYFSPDFPCVAPVICLVEGSNRAWIPIRWCLTDAAPDALARRLVPILRTYFPKHTMKESSHAYAK